MTPPFDPALQEQALQQAADLLRKAQHAVVFTGAGFSTPSGIPDFRSQNTGLWQRFDPMEVASIGAFQSHPEKFYGWLRPLLLQIWAASPNPAHLALAQLEASGFIQAVITQNIDDLHQRAGSQHVYEVHGSLHTMTCPTCETTYPSEQFRAALEDPDQLPRCPRCQQSRSHATILKPDITLYGEMLPEDVWSEAETHCIQSDLIIVAGSSLEVWPAASLPELALENGARLILINLSPTFLDEKADVRIPANVAAALPALVERLR
jgi:NAD-dependent deacetylase